MVSTARLIGSVPDSERMHVPDAPIDRSIPYEPRGKNALRLSRHFGFFPFFAKKPWQVVQAYIDHYTAPGDLVCDPFAGSGVTPVEALVLGRRAVASDINPVARFITRMTAIAPVDIAGLDAAYSRVRAAVQSRIEALDAMSDRDLLRVLDTLDYPRGPIPHSVRRADLDSVDLLHTPRQLAGLTMLRDAIAREPDVVSRDMLRVALATTVRYANRTYSLPFERGKRRSPYHGDAVFLRRFSFSPASPDLFYELPVWSTFVRRYEATRAVKEETNRIIGARFGVENFVLADVPAARIHEITGEGAVDYCFADPPYSNVIPFLDLSTLWAAWLDMPITAEAREAELLVDTKRPDSRARFAREFAASAESIARALKDERWLTLVYKHRDLSLWQTIVETCEASGLQYVNAVWQDVKVSSTRQNESPNINPTGDMYLNFRKMAPQRFETIYGRARILDLPTRANYLEHAVERLVVAYLGADIELIVSEVVGQALDNRAFRADQENPEAITRDLEQVFHGPRFQTWKPPHGKVQWVMAAETALDASLDAADRARYAVFELLRERGEVSEGEVSQYLLTRLAENVNRDHAAETSTLLRSVGRQVGLHRWQFDPARVAEYKQLRLFFRPSRADEMRERMERHGKGHDDRNPIPDLEGFALLRERLAEANRDNRAFAVQYNRLREVLLAVLLRLRKSYGPRIGRVMVAGELAREGIDLRNLPYEDIVLDIVLRDAERPFALHWEIAEQVFVDLGDDDLLVQFRLVTLPEWERAEALATAQGRIGALGIPLLSDRE